MGANMEMISTGLTLDGLAAQIVSSITIWKKTKLGTINDCQVVVNHLIRKHHERLLAETRLGVPCTGATHTARQRGEKTFKERP